MSTPTRTELMVLQQLSLELQEAGHDIPADVLGWALTQYRVRLLRRAGDLARERDMAEVRRRTVDWRSAHGCGGLS